MAIFPQINSNMIMTQLPYSAGQSYGTISQDVETGMRWTFPLRASGLSGFPTDTLRRFNLSFPTITDAEVASLKTFFESMRGRWGQFGLLDPAGNLVQYSEDFSQSYWDKSMGPTTVGSSATDPFGGSLATQLDGGAVAARSAVSGIIGQSSGGMSGYAMNITCYVKALSSGISATVGFRDSGGTVHGSGTIAIASGVWTKLEYSFILSDNNQWKAVVLWTKSTSIDIFGIKVSAMKGSGGYAKAPDFYGWHPNCRFNTDQFTRQVAGPNENSVQLPVVEFWS